MICTRTNLCDPCIVHENHADALANANADCGCMCVNEYESDTTPEAPVAPSAKEDTVNLNKGDRARTAAYNAAYVEFVRKAVANGEGVDEGILVAAHSFAAWTRDRNAAECRCYGTGVFHLKTEGTDKNGAQNVVQAVCFGCNGKGFQTRDDQARNWGYWSFYAKVSL